MPKRKTSDPKAEPFTLLSNNGEAVSLKTLAAHLGLSTTSLSVVLNNAPSANSIPQETKDRIFAAAKAFNYRPNYLARSFRSQRTHTLGVLVPELSDGYSAMVLSGVEDELLRHGFFYIIASHRHRDDLMDYYPKLFVDRCVEGIIAVDTPYNERPLVPLVAVSGQKNAIGITNIVLDHPRAAVLALEHFQTLGHERIAFIKGQDFSSDTEIRWASIADAARERRIEIRDELVEQLKGDLPSPELGYQATRKLLATGEPFTALFAFNDIAAIGAMRAIRDAGLSVPEDISVMGFDDIHAAAFHNPALTTIRQPLFEMGQLAARTLLSKIAKSDDEQLSESLTIEPTLVVRQSTALARTVESRVA